MDVLKEEKEYKVTEWSRGVIKRVVPDPQDLTVAQTVEIGFFGDIGVKNLTVNIDSDKFAPFGTKREPDEWKEKIKVGDEIDCCDNCKVWRTSTVIKLDPRGEEAAMPMLTIGFRRYTAMGDKSDTMGSFFGFSQSCDERVGQWSVRIQRPLTYVKETGISVPVGTTTSTGSSLKGESVVSLYSKEQDESDLLLMTDKDATIFAIERLKCKSTALVELVNRFGEKGGFKKILELVADKDTSIDAVHFIIKSLGGLAENLHKSFVDKFVQALADALMSKFMNSTEAHLRNFRKEKVAEMIDTLFNRLMARLLPNFEVQVAKSKFSLKLGVLYMQQKFLQKRIEGAKFIDFVCNQAISQPEVELRQQLVTELKEANILDEFFSKTKVHSYLIQSSEGFIKIMIKQKQMTAEDLEMIWTNVSTDEDMRVEFYKVISGVSVEGAEQL